MDELIYWIVFFGVLTLVMNFINKKWFSKLPKEALLTDKEVEVLEKKKFPLWQQVLYPLIIVVPLVGTPVILLLLSAGFIYRYPHWVLDVDYIALSTNPAGLYLILLVFFPGIALGAYFLTPIYRRFPGLARFMEAGSLKQWGMRVRADAELPNKPFILFGLIGGLLCLGLVFLAADNYYYVDEEAVHSNPFWGFNEHTLSLDSLEKIEAGAWPNNGRNASGINWEYVLVFSTGERFDMKEADAANLKRLDDLLMERKIPVEITTLDEDAIVWINESAPADLKELLTQVFNDSR